MFLTDQGRGIGHELTHSEQTQMPISDPTADDKSPKPRRAPARMQGLDACRGSPSALETERRQSTRRRLWHLPALAHELVLGAALEPDELRREATRVLGKIHRARCVLEGRDVDVLFSVARDMATRNGLSEALQRRLDERHAVALRLVRPLRDAESLSAAWRQALDGESMPSMLWAVLTHPYGGAIETSVLYDARHWLFGHARRSLRISADRRQAESRAEQERARADDLRMRLSTHERAAAEALEAALFEIARLRGEAARLRAAAAAATPGNATVPSASAGAAVKEEKTTERRPPDDAKPVQTPHPRPSATAVKVAEPTALAGPSPAEMVHAPSNAMAISGRRVLCVGGIRHAVARYRERIERLGGCFEHHDGGLEDGIQALDGRLTRAEVVICQAGCINHEAYHRIKRHCERTGTPCVYLERPSLSRFDRALAGISHSPTH